MDCSTGAKADEETPSVTETGEESDNKLMTRTPNEASEDSANETITLWKAEPENVEKTETIITTNHENEDQVENLATLRQHRNIIRSSIEKEAVSPRPPYYTPTHNNGELEDPQHPPYQPPSYTPNPSPQNYHMEQQNQNMNSYVSDQTSPPHSTSVVVQNMHHVQVPPLLSYDGLKYEEELQNNGTSPPTQQSTLLSNSTYATLEPVHLQPPPSYSPPNSNQYITTTSSNSAGYYLSYPKPSNDPLYVKTDPNLGSTTSKMLQHHYDPPLAYDDSPQYSSYNRAIVTTEAYWLPNGANMVEYSTPTPPASYSAASAHHHHHHLALSAPLTLPGEATLELRPPSVAGLGACAPGASYTGQMTGQSGHTQHWINTGGLPDELYDPGMDSNS
jgi:hypothetical protein